MSSFIVVAKLCVQVVVNVSGLTWCVHDCAIVGAIVNNCSIRYVLMNKYSICKTQFACYLLNISSH